MYQCGKSTSLAQSRTSLLVFGMANKNTKLKVIGSKSWHKRGCVKKNGFIEAVTNARRARTRSAILSHTLTMRG